MGINLAQTSIEAPAFAASPAPEVEARPEVQFLPGFLEPGQATPPAGNLSVIPDRVAQPPADIDKPSAFISADAVPELFERRQAARQRATEILAQNSHKLHNGRAAEVPAAVDPLGTAKAVVRVKRTFGAESPEFQEVFSGLVFDSGRLLGEAASKNKSEHFAPKEQEFDPKVQAYYSHGLPITDMLVNGLSPAAEPEEQDRRVNGEFVEEVGTYVPMGTIIAKEGLRGLVERLPLPIERELPTVSVEATTFSMCTDYAERDYEINPKGSHGGYRPAMKGIAIRQMHFEDDAGHREEEQVIISGIYITQDIIEDYMAEKGALEQGQRLTKTELLATQFISVNGGGLMEIVRELDEKASSIHGINLFMGEEVPADHPKDYTEFMAEAEERRKRLEPMPTQLANFLVDLEERGIDSQRAGTLVSDFLREKLLAVVKKNPELAEAMFDKATAEGFAEVARLEALGKHEEAWHHQRLVEENAPEVSYCGAGSCGLESVDASNPMLLEAKRLGLKGKLLHDKERACPRCTEKKICYGDNGKACTGCGYNDVGGTPAKTNLEAAENFRQETRQK